MRGRPRKPTALLKLEKGRPDRIREREAAEPKPEISDEVPLPLAELSDEAKQHWMEVAPALHGCKILTQIDLPAFGAYCETYCQWRKAQDKLQATGMVLIDQNGNPRMNPYIGIANRALGHLQKFWAEFGMAPASRARISLTDRLGAGAPETDPFAAFLAMSKSNVAR